MLKGKLQRPDAEGKVKPGAPPQGHRMPEEAAADGC